MIRRYLLPYRRLGNKRVAKATRQASFRPVVNRGSVRGLGWRIKDPDAEIIAEANLRPRSILGVQQANAAQQAARQSAIRAGVQLAALLGWQVKDPDAETTVEANLRARITLGAAQANAAQQKARQDARQASSLAARWFRWQTKDPAAETTAVDNLRVRFGLGVQQANANQRAARQGATAANGQLAQFRRLRRHALMVDSGHIAQVGSLASIQASQARTRSGSDQANAQLRQFRRLRRFALMVDSGHIFIAGWLASVQARRRAIDSAQTSLRLWRTMVYLPPYDPTTYIGYIDLTELRRGRGFIEIARGELTEPEK